jgi:hypothetical protein
MKFSTLVLTAALLLPYVGANNGNGNGGGGQGNGNGKNKDEEVPVAECPCYQAEEDIQVVLNAAIAGGGGVTACSGAELVITGSFTGPFSLETPNLGSITVSGSGEGDLTFSFLADTNECSYDGVVLLDSGGSFGVNGFSESSGDTAPYAACSVILNSFC